MTAERVTLAIEYRRDIQGDLIKAGRKLIAASEHERNSQQITNFYTHALSELNSSTQNLTETISSNPLILAGLGEALIHEVVNPQLEQLKLHHGLSDDVARRYTALLLRRLQDIIHKMILDISTKLKLLTPP